MNTREMGTALHLPEVLVGGKGKGLTRRVPLPTTPRSTTAGAEAAEGPASLLLLPCPTWALPKLPAIWENAACMKQCTVNVKGSHITNRVEHIHMHAEWMVIPVMLWLLP